MNQEVDPVMKRILLFGIVLAIFILAMPQGVLALNAAEVTANVQSELEFGVTGLAGWSLDQGPNTAPNAITYTVIANSPWSVTVAPSSLTAGTTTPIITDGKMYATKTAHNLADILEIERVRNKVKSGLMVDVTTTDKILYDDASPTSAGIVYFANLGQLVAWNDERLTNADDVYKITLTFTATPDINL